MKGYTVGSGFMGYVDGKYILFASEADYYEFMEEAAQLWYNTSVRFYEWNMAEVSCLPSAIEKEMYVL